MKKLLQKIKSAKLHPFFSILLGMFGLIFLGRFYEWALIIFNHGGHLATISYIAPAIVYDFTTALAFSIPTWVVFKGLHKVFPKRALSIITLLITLVGLCHILLISYFSATLVPLGPEFWAYSISEMSETIIASNQLTVWGIILLVITTIFFYIGINKIIRTGLSNNSYATYASMGMVGIISLSILGTIFSSGSTTYSFKANKLTYFLNQSIHSSEIFYSEGPLSNIEQEYPFLHQAKHKNVLGPYFQKTDSPPNVVFLMVESLGGEFVGPSGQWTGFAPFIDSLAHKGLYWENGLSLSGRTFGLVPSLLGSLPPVRNGFMDHGPSYPNHHSLISLMGEAGYHTSFFSGYDTYFDNLDFFLRHQGTDFTLNKQLIEESHQSSSRDAENYWGINDKRMFEIASGILDTLSHSPRLEIYHTLQNHSPFIVPDPKGYRQKFNQRLRQLNLSDSKKERYRRYEAELTALLYTDDAIRSFIEDYRQREEYQQTIFVITGDHWLIPIPQTNQISRYHVPIIIYSPLLKKSNQFKSVNTHANVVPSLTAYLNQFPSVNMPDSVHWVGSELDTAHTFRNIHSIPLMKNKNQLTDYLHNGYYLAEDQLFQLDKNLNLVKAQNKSVSQELRNKLEQFKDESRYAMANDKLWPSNSEKKSENEYDFLVRYDSLFKVMKEQNLTIDQKFEQARQYAFDAQYDVARAIARRILLQYPDYHDARILMGRTNAWEGNYEQARIILKNALERDPSYYDTYNALSDTEFWAGNYKASLSILNDGLEYHPTHQQFLEKKIRTLAQLDRQADAQQVFEKYKKEYPESHLLSQLKQLL